MKHLRGQGSIEFLAIFLGFAALLLGLFEMTRLYRAKHVLNTATFAATRAGALHHARAAAMNAELANGMAPLLMLGYRSAAQLTVARERALALIRMPGVGVQIVSPTRAGFLQLRATQWVRLAGDRAFLWQDVIPNDNLRLRPRATADAGNFFPPDHVTVQDANLLRIRSLWCHRLITPVLDRAIFFVLNSAAFITERQKVCSAISALTGPSIVEGYYVAVSGDAVVRMQSPVVADDLP